MDSYLSVLAKRLLPLADEINAYRGDDGQILGYARDASGSLLPWPTMDEFEAEWEVLQAELSAEQPAPSLTVEDLQARMALLEDAILELFAGGL